MSIAFFKGLRDDGLKGWLVGAVWPAGRLQPCQILSTATHTNTGGQTDTRLYFSNSQTNISSRSLKSPEVFRGLIQRLLVRLHPSLMLKHKNHVFKVVSAFVAWM